MCVCMYVCMYVCVCVCLCVYITVCVCVYVCVWGPPINSPYLVSADRWGCQVCSPPGGVPMVTRCPICLY